MALVCETLLATSSLTGRRKPPSSLACRPALPNLTSIGPSAASRRRAVILACSRVDGASTRIAENAEAAKDESSSSSGSERPSSEGQRPSSGGPPRRDLDSDEEVSAIMEGVSFAQLCDDFECVSSPAVERTARLLARDIHDIREDRRSLSCFAVDVKYKDPLRSFTGRDKYRRVSWIFNGLEKPKVDMMSMEMLSTSVLVIRWRLRGGFRSLPGADLLQATLDLVVTSTFTLNQISGQVLEHRDEWDLSKTPLQGTLLFYSSRLAWSTVQTGKDLSESSVGQALEKAKGGDDSAYYPDPSGDPRKFFVQDNPNRELYQFALAVALLYLVVQFLRQVI